MRNSLVIVFAFLLFSGCEKKAEKVVEKQVHNDSFTTSYEKLSPSSEIVKVNGIVLTKCELEREVDYQVELGKLRNPKRSSAEWARKRPKMLFEARERFVCRELYLQEAAKAELKVPNQEDILAVSNNLIVLSGQKGKSLSDVRKLLSPESAKLLDAHLMVDALVQTYLRIKAGKYLEITDKDYEEYCAQIKKLQDWSAVEFEKAKKLGTELIDRFHNGEDFGKLADEFSLARQKEGYDGPGGVWGEFMPATLLDEEVRQALKKTPVGECTPPIETPEGLYIVLVEERKGAGENSIVNLNPETLKMRRIVLRLPMRYQALNRQQFETQALANRFKEMQKKLLIRLSDKAAIDYPNGTNLWVRVGKARGD